MSFVERSIILCPYLGGSTIGGSTVVGQDMEKSVSIALSKKVIISDQMYLWTANPPLLYSHRLQGVH